MNMQKDSEFGRRKPKAAAKGKASGLKEPTVRLQIRSDSQGEGKARW